MDVGLIVSQGSDNAPSISTINSLQTNWEVKLKLDSLQIALFSEN
jgi:hypothetical protein